MKNICKFALSLSLAAPFAAFAQQLGPAPQVLDFSAVPRLALPKAAITGNPINTQHRGESVGHFYSRWWAFLSVPAGWTGSIAGCNAGTISAARQDATITTVDYYRALAGLPDTVTLSPTLSDSANTSDQQMALMMVANNQLNHDPPASWICYTAAGHDAASHSNLALGASGPDAIDLYMDDPGAGNGAAGHRRWILYPPQAQMGSGDVEGNGAPTSSNALNVINGWGSRPASPEWVAWPPPGYVPYQVLPANSNRWSFSYPAADFSGASVTMTRGATNIPVTFETQETGFGDNTLVFLPQGFSYAPPAADTTYSITVNNVVVNGTPRSFAYSVTVFKPQKPSMLGDLDNDGQSDLVWKNISAQQTATWFMKGGAVDHDAFGSIPSGWSLRGVGDVDGDGNADLVWTNAGANLLAVWFMDGSTHADTSFFGIGGGWDLAAVGDLNGDAKADFVFRNSNGSVAAWFMSKAGVTGTVFYPNVGSDWALVGTGDFVGARKDQLLWSFVPTGDLYLWANADTPSVQLVSLGRPGGSWQLRAVGDFDGDGTADLFFRSGTGENAMWLGGQSGNAVFPPGVGTDWAVIGATQAYGDGRSNPIWQRTDGVVALWRLLPSFVPTAKFLPTVPPGWLPASS